ncbi:MAG: hypothetical protein NTV63_01655, partial [Candidatus Woesearchaeota archaeon]|nr:hypothetical protein [Candidatus Woesearchaeota archaeon]
INKLRKDLDSLISGARAAPRAAPQVASNGAQEYTSSNSQSHTEQHSQPGTPPPFGQAPRGEGAAPEKRTGNLRPGDVKIEQMFNFSGGAKKRI